MVQKVTLAVFDPTTKVAKASANAKGIPVVDTGGGAGAPEETQSGLYLALGAANTDPGGVAIPAGAVGVLLWFELSTADDSYVRGRLAFTASATVVGGLADTQAGKLGYTPKLPVNLRIPAGKTHLHVASATANAVARGSWLF